eukprot:14577148-Alexandrium_andersonii.AAC.1
MPELRNPMPGFRNPMPESTIPCRAQQPHVGGTRANQLHGAGLVALVLRIALVPARPPHWCHVAL